MLLLPAASALLTAVISLRFFALTGKSKAALGSRVVLESAQSALTKVITESVVMQY
jgi:hypothetical protein